MSRRPEKKQPGKSVSRISVVFDAKIISFFAKKARGLMVRYIIDTNAETIEDLKGFNYEGYQFDANLSQGNQLIFTR